ncbi:MAG: hypothetical protein ACXVC6_09340 [Bacteroidia bacterium]
MESNREIEKTMSSLEGMIKAEANPFFYDKVMNRLNGKEAKVIVLKPGVLWKAAASVAILVTLNILVLVRNNHSENLTAQENTNPVAKEYFSYFSNSQF